jgi:hypothetical protein
VFWNEKKIEIDLDQKILAMDRKKITLDPHLVNLTNYIVKM